MDEMFNNSQDLFDLANLIKLENSKVGSIGAYQVPIPIVLEEDSGITIPRGFSRDGSNPITWKTSIDRHTLKAITKTVSLPASILVQENSEAVETMVNIYQVRLMGMLNYNIVHGDFVTKETAFSDGRVIFSSNGVIPINMIIGYVADVSEIRSDLLENIVFDVVNDKPTLMKRGERIVYEPSNPDAFYAEFDGSIDMIFTLPFSVFMTVNPVIS